MFTIWAWFTNYPGPPADSLITKELCADVRRLTQHLFNWLCFQYHSGEWAHQRSMGSDQKHKQKELMALIAAYTKFKNHLDYVALSPSPFSFPFSACCACLVWERRRRMRPTDSGGFFQSVLLAIPLSTHPYPLQQESSCVSVSVSSSAAGGQGRVTLCPM